MMKAPLEDDFRSGRFYRNWIRQLMMATITMVLLGVVNVGLLIYEAVHHNSISVLILMIGTLSCGQFLYRIPAQLRDVKRRWARSNQLLARDSKKTQ
jgi:hypothetical protein